MDLKSHITSVPDFPKPGINFRDCLPLLAQPRAFRFVINTITERWIGKVDAVVVLEARGFFFGTPLILSMNVPCVPIRKKGKLPGKTIAMEYALEYGTDVMEMNPDFIKPGMRVLVVDDLLATGGTAEAACKLVESTGAHVVGCAFIIELASLGGRKKLSCPIQSLVTYEKE